MNIEERVTKLEDAVETLASGMTTIKGMLGGMLQIVGSMMDSHHLLEQDFRAFRTENRLANELILASLQRLENGGNS